MPLTRKRGSDVFETVEVAGAMDKRRRTVTSVRHSIGHVDDLQKAVSEVSVSSPRVKRLARRNSTRLPSGVLADGSTKISHKLRRRASVRTRRRQSTAASCTTVELLTCDEDDTDLKHTAIEEKLSEAKENNWSPVKVACKAVNHAIDASLTYVGHCETAEKNRTPLTCLTPPTPKTPVASGSPGALEVSEVRDTLADYLTSTSSALRTPLPKLGWADSKELWKTMIAKENQHCRDVNMLQKQRLLQPHMRSVLFDWLMEVCEVYNLHRETFHLTVDFVDRYLSITENVPKQQLQLIGITSLFVAAKLEEIYPPKLTEFAYVTDGACSEQDILDQELILLQVLTWDLSPLTPNTWLNLFMQLLNRKTNKKFTFPYYSQRDFCQIARLIDLCFLDIGSLRFSYSVLATSALYHLSSKDIACSISGYTWNDIEPCSQWMVPFAVALREKGEATMRSMTAVANDDIHNIQTHAVDLDVLDYALFKANNIASARSRSSPDLPKEHCIMTPPSSSNSKKLNENEVDDSDEDNQAASI